MPHPEPKPPGRRDDDDENAARGHDRGGSEAADAWDGQSTESAASQARRLLTIAAGAGLAYGVSLRDAPYPDQAAAKVLMCGLLFLACARHEPMGERLRMMAALAASAVGDALLALPELAISFVGGLGAFLVAHVAYCALLAPRAMRAASKASASSARTTAGWRAGADRLGFPPWRRAAVGLLWAAGLAMFLVFRPHLNELAVPVAFYMLALCAMASFALMARAASPALAVGGLAFVASDTMIGIDRFLTPFTGSAYWIWLTYAVAQVSIAAGILLPGRRIP